jgi:hypothetical protein
MIKFLAFGGYIEKQKRKEAENRNNIEHIIV